MQRRSPPHPRLSEVSTSARAGSLTALDTALAVSNEVVVIPVGTRRFDQCNSHLRRWAMRIQNTVRPNSQHLTRLKGIPKAIAVDLWTKIPVAVRIAEVCPIVRPNGTRGARDHGGRGQQRNGLHPIGVNRCERVALHVAIGADSPCNPSGFDVTKRPLAGSYSR